MSYKDFTKTRTRVLSLHTDAMFSTLIEKTVERVHDLELFYSVGVLLRPTEKLRYPSCVIIPRGIEVVEQQLSGARFAYDYIVDFAIVVRHPNDCIMMQQVLYLAQKLRESFSKGDSSNILTFSEVSEHYNTTVGSDTVEPLQEIAPNALSFSSGVSVTYSVWVSI